MAVKSARYIGGPATADTNRGPSEFIWGAPGAAEAWVEEFIQDPSFGMYVWDDFQQAGSPSFYPATAVEVGSMGQWGIILPIGGGAVDAGVVGGVLSLACGSLALASTNQDTAVIYSNVGPFQITSASSGGLQGRLAFECRVALTSIVSAQRDAFIGLVDQAPGSAAAVNALFPFTLLSTGATANTLTSTRNRIGFYNAASNSNSDWGFCFGLASTALVSCSNLQNLVSNVTGTAIVAGTYYKLGFVFEPTNAAPQLPITKASDGQTVGTIASAMLTVYVNGIRAAAFLTKGANILTASFPTGVMGAIAAYAPATSGAGQSASNSAGLMNIDWIRVAQTGVT